MDTNETALLLKVFQKPIGEFEGDGRARARSFSQFVSIRGSLSGSLQA